MFGCCKLEGGGCYLLLLCIKSVLDCGLAQNAHGIEMAGARPAISMLARSPHLPPEAAKGSATEATE